VPTPRKLLLDLGLRLLKQGDSHEAQTGTISTRFRDRICFFGEFSASTISLKRRVPASRASPACGVFASVMRQVQKRTKADETVNQR
jgi:hypothetical protein